jgi:hypothetical protein
MAQDSKMHLSMDVFQRFAGSNQMAGKEFVKLCKDSGLFSKKFTSAHADLVFTKVKEHGERKIDFDAFKKAVAEVAKAKGMSEEEIWAKLSSAEPVFNATKVQAVALHDNSPSAVARPDKSQGEVARERRKSEEESWFYQNVGQLVR